MDLAKMKAKLQEIANSLAKFDGVELTDEDITSIDNYSAEYEALTKKIEAAEKMETIKNSASSSTRKVPAQTNAPVKAEVEATRTEKNGGFKNFGEFLVSTKKAGTGGEIDKRFNNVMFEKNGEDGGFLVPEEMLTDITKKLGSDESLLSRTRQFTISGNALTLPTDETQPWTGGIQAYWTAEGAPIADSKLKFGQASWRLHKLAALVKTTDELLEDAVALESYIRAMAPEAIMHKVNEAILTGNGSGKPLGILNSDFRVVVAKEAGQLADTIVARNVIKMYSRMIPSSRANAVWYINAMCEEQLRTMKDDEGHFIYLTPGSQMNQSVYATLLGRPVIPLLGAMPALGDEGDIVLADLSYYYTLLKSSGVKNAVSTHLLFDRDQTAYKFILRVDGSCPFKSPVVTQYGSYQMSAFVTLEARA